MLLAPAAILVLAALLQAPLEDRAQAERLARDGRTAEAMALFARILLQDPRDDEARQWLARLSLRVGRTADAEAAFRDVLSRHPDDIDARIGLGITLTREGQSRAALDILEPLESVAAGNGDLLAALARAHRRAGNDEKAFEYFARARARAPDDPDVAAGFEATARVYLPWVALEGFGQGGAPGAGVSSGSADGDVRVTMPLHLQFRIRVQQGAGYSDAIGGAGMVWRIGRATNVLVRASAGSGNVALPARDLTGGVAHYAGAFEVGGQVHGLTFAGSRIVALSPLVAWESDRWRLDARYTYSRSSFEQTGETSGDHSVLLRGTWRRWRRAAIGGGYAYGIESFENLTADRLDALGSTTVPAVLQIDLPSLLRVTATWEHQWRSNHTTIDRVSLSLTQMLR